MNPFNLSLDAVQWVESTLESLTLEQKVGQLFCPMMMEDRLSAEEQMEEYAVRIREEHDRFMPGGYYLNRYYLPTTPTLLNLLLERSVVPPIICADMEAGAGGGFGGVIAPGMVTFPPPMGVGASGSERYAYQVGRCTAWQARAIGVHFIFAPSLDVSVNPDNPIINIRSFGEDPKAVARLGAAYIRGVQDGGGVASAKHFPGHGDTSEDTHLQLSTITADRERLDEVELYPFRRAIDEAGVYAIMTGHLAVPALEADPKLPATLSSVVLQDLLRGELGFEGLIVTDALLMGGITTLYESGEAALKAFLAGADWLLMSPDMDAAYNAILDAAKSGVVSSGRLDESVNRVLSMKAKSGVHYGEPVDLESLRNLGELNNYPTRVSYAACDGAVTLVKNERAAVPLSGHESIAAVMLTDEDDEYYDDGYSFFHEVSARSLGETDYVSLLPGADESQHHAALEAIENADVVLFGLITQVLPEKDSVDLPEEYVRLIEAAVAKGKKTAVVSFGNPYLLRRILNVDAYLCAYAYFSPMVGSVAEVLYGERVPNAKLPVSIPGVCEIGAGDRF